MSNIRYISWRRAENRLSSVNCRYFILEESMEVFAYLIPYGLEWLNLIVRWLHIITGIAWRGASFYFVWLDNSIRPPAPGSELARKGVTVNAICPGYTETDIVREAVQNIV
eukprot:gene23315-43801_t